MKKNNVILLLSLLALVSCSSSGASSSSTISSSSSSAASITKADVLEALLGNIKVSAVGSWSRSYPSDYSYLDSVTSIIDTVDYSHYTDSDGDRNTASRVYDGDNYTTYYRTGDGYATTMYLLADNTVKSDFALVRGAEILYNDYFLNPFSYVDVDDIGDDYSFALEKASFLVSRLTGYDRPVTSAKFIMSDGLPTGLDLAYTDTTEIYEGTSSSDTSNIITGLDVLSSFKLSISIVTGLNDIASVTPRTGTDAALINALVNNTNMTITFQSDSSTSTSIVYVTDDAIYSHYGINSVGASNGDYYLKANGDGTYTSYYYSSSAASWAVDSLHAKKESYVMDFGAISPSIFMKESDNLYSLDLVSATYGSAALILPQYAFGDGYGMSASLSLKNNKVSTYKATFYPTSPFSVSESFYDYGTTSIPSWLDVGQFE